MSEVTERYDVVLLVEEELSDVDAREVRALHLELDDEMHEHVCYHLLLPVEDAASRIEGALGGFAAGEALAPPGMLLDEADLERIRSELVEQAREHVRVSLERLRATGAEAHGEMVSVDPIEALGAKVDEVDGREAIILTRPHVVKEFFHVDWTSRARRSLNVPVLHLLEHESTKDAVAGQGEGAQGF